MTIYEEILIKYSKGTSKYLNWYLNLVKTRKSTRTDKRSFKAETNSNWAENHHILPRCMVPVGVNPDDKSNIVVLTAREHYIAHLLLTKIDFPENIKRKLLKAFTAMSVWNLRKINSRMSEKIKHQIKALGDSEETIKKRVETLKKTKSKNPGFYAEIARKNLKHITPDRHWTKIAKNVDEIKLKQSEKAKIREANRTEDYKLQFAAAQSQRKSAMKWITDGIATKAIHKDLPLPDGWRYGRTFNKHKSNSDL